MADDPPIVIRPATAADLPVIVAMLADDDLGATREQATEPLPDAYLEAFAEIDGNPDHRLLVAEVAGAVVGTLQLSSLRHLTHRGGRRAQVEGVRVARTARGTGIGRALLEHAIDEARRSGCRMVQLTTDVQRPDARAFYEDLGFTASHLGMKLHLG